MDANGYPDESEAPVLEPGTRLGKYEVIRLLGAGGMGAVYEANHGEIGKRVAVKVLSPAIAAIPGARTRFLREAQLTSKVRHPNIVDVTDMGSDGGNTYIVMEFLRGEDLSQRLGRFGALSAQDIADIMLPVCSAVAEAHIAGVTHRDLKPQNIFLAAGPHTEQPKVLDFGISKGADSPSGSGTLTGTGAMIGTPFYIAPEQILDSKSAGPASDQYALGVILYECLTGSRPFHGDNLFMIFQAIVNGMPAAPHELRPDVPPALEHVVLRAMNVDPRARFSSVDELGRALLAFASPRVRTIWEGAFGAGDGTPPPPVTARTPVTMVMPTPGPAVTPRPSGATPAADTGGRPRSAGGFRPRPKRNTDGLDTERIRPASSSGGLRAALIIGGVMVLGVGVFLFVRAQAGGTDGPNPDTTVGTTTGSTTKILKKSLSSADTYPVAITVEPATAEIELDGQNVGTGSLDRTLPADHAQHRLRITAEGYEGRTLEFSDVNEPPPRIALERVTPPPARAEAQDTRPSPDTRDVADTKDARDKKDDKRDDRKDSTARAGGKPSGGHHHPTHPVKEPREAKEAPPSSQPRGLNPNGAPVID